MPSSKRNITEGQGQGERSFRLIDFGRSRKGPSQWDLEQNRKYDERALEKLFPEKTSV